MELTVGVMVKKSENEMSQEEKVLNPGFVATQSPPRGRSRVGEVQLAERNHRENVGVCWSQVLSNPHSHHGWGVDPTCRSGCSLMQVGWGRGMS